MRVVIETFARDALRFSADYVIDKIRLFQPSTDKPFTLVLPNPEPQLAYFFECMVNAYKEKKVSFENVIFFELEEFRGIEKSDPRSYASRLYEVFFRYVDAKAENVHFLNGTAHDYIKECEQFEEAIRQSGGLDLVCVNVDYEGCLGGNTPGSSLSSKTRQKTRTSFVINDRSYSRKGFGDIDAELITPRRYEDIPTDYVLTMGLDTIMKSQEVFAFFLGNSTSRALHHVLEESVNNLFPASILQLHERACIICDKHAMSTLQYTTVEYFVGIRDTYNEVYHLKSNMPFGLTPYELSKNCENGDLVDNGAGEVGKEMPHLQESEVQKTKA